MEEYRALPCTQQTKKRSVRKVVIQVCSGDWREPAERNTARKMVPLPLNEQFQWLVANKKCVCPGWREEFRGEDKAQHAQGKCRGVGWDMAQVNTKVGERVQPVS